MRATRAPFKLALREWRANEERLRAEALASKLTDANMKEYWSDIRKAKPRPCKLTNNLDGVSGEENIVNLWRRKYERLFNCIDPTNRHDALFAKEDIPKFFRIEDVTEALKHLSIGKAAGVDGIPAEVWTGAPRRLVVYLTLFINACVRHCYLPPLLMQTTLIPLLKNKLKPATDSDNYRLIAYFHF